MNRLCIVVVMLLSTTAAYPDNSLPIIAGERLYLSISPPTNTMPSPEWAQDIYRERFSKMPDCIIWDGDQDTSSVNIQIASFKEYYPDDPYPWWGDSLKWGQLRPYLQVVFTSTEDGDTLCRDMPLMDENKIISLDSTGIIDMKFSIPVWKIPVPNDGFAWDVEIQPKIDISDSVMVNPRRKISATMVRTTRTTALDSLLWLHTFQNRVEIPDSYYKEVLASYPHVKFILKKMFGKYYRESNCDSVQHYGSLYLESLVNNLDGFSGLAEIRFPNESVGLDSTLVDRVNEMIDDICVDGFPQPEKYRGITE